MPGDSQSRVGKRGPLISQRAIPKVRLSEIYYDFGGEFIGVARRATKFRFSREEPLIGIHNLSAKVGVIDGAIVLSICELNSSADLSQWIRCIIFVSFSFEFLRFDIDLRKMYVSSSPLNWFDFRRRYVRTVKAPLRFPPTYH